MYPVCGAVSADSLSGDRRETVAYDSREMPVYIRKNTLSEYSPNMSALCHWHDDVEFLYIRNGYMYYNINGEVIKLNQGEGVFVNSRQLHYGYSADRHDCEFLCVLLNPVLLGSMVRVEKKYIEPLTSNQAFSYMLFSHHDTLSDLLRSVYDIYTNAQDGFELELQILFYQIWLILYKYMPKNASDSDYISQDRSSLREILSFLKTHYNEKLSIPEIAASGGVSQSKCFQIFRNCVGCTPMEYLTEYRLTESRRLLSETDFSMTEIAGRVGFGSSSYYTLCFRRQYHCTPSEYRKRNANRD